MKKLRHIDVKNPLDKAILCQCTMIEPEDGVTITFVMYVDNTYRTDQFDEEKEMKLTYRLFKIENGKFFWKDEEEDDWLSDSDNEIVEQVDKLLVGAYLNAMDEIDRALLGE